MTMKQTTRATAKTLRKRKSQTVGESIAQGLKEAIAWTQGKNDKVRVTIAQAPDHTALARSLKPRPFVK